ncbi:MAG: ribosome maturation factor RimM [Pseudomonadota bacterium]
MAVAERICLGVITGPHGVRGGVRLKSFTEVPEDIASYGPLVDQVGARSFHLTLTGRSKGLLLGRIKGIEDRDQAEALSGTRLHVSRAVLPEIDEPETFYHADLVGLAAEDPEGRPLGQVIAVQNFGAGDLLEIRPQSGGGSELVAFTKEAVPRVDLANGKLTLVVPQTVEAAAQDADASE